MTKKPRSTAYIRHLIQALERINRYTSDLDQNSFINSELVQSAVIRNIELLGDASINILRKYPEFAAQHNKIPWLLLYTMRIFVSRGHENVDFEILWKTIQRDLPMIHSQILALKPHTR